MCTIQCTSTTNQDQDAKHYIQININFQQNIIRVD